MSKSEPRNTSSRSMRVDTIPDWNQINWKQAKEKVKQLQARIVKAQQQKRHAKVKSLSRILTRSFYAKALAVKQVSSNRGARTAGIDGEIWRTKQRKAQAILELQQEAYRAKPLKRLYIKKSNGKKRPLGIPTMKDRAMQALYAMALKPIAETTADAHSYGFRPYRCCQDAIDQISKLVCRKKRPEWILEGDIKGCFDNICHNWILEHIPIEKKVLQQWLKCGYIDQGKLYHTEFGTPQGGIISPTIANMVLDGLEEEIYELYKKRIIKNGKTYWTPMTNRPTARVNIIRYADDFVVTGASKEMLEDEVKPIICEFLKIRGLALSDEKTVVTNLKSGFDFLGFNIRSYKRQVIIKPAKTRIKQFRDKVSAIIKRYRASETKLLISKLNPLLRGWTNYYRFVSSKQTFAKLSHWLLYKTWKWAKRRHSKKGGKWIRKKYYTSKENRNWVFFHKDDDKTHELFVIEHVKITRHKKIKSMSNPFSTEDVDYYEQRKRNYKRS